MKVWIFLKLSSILKKEVRATLIISKIINKNLMMKRMLAI
jgi:hypothetical protein